MTGDAQARAWANKVAKGFNTTDVPMEFGLLYEEVGEPFSAWRKGRPDLLREISLRCRAVVWLNPEPPARWGTGDSAIESYRRVVDFVLPCGILRELQSCLSYIF